MDSRIITFHSYKGGAGRSSTTLNTLPHIVEAFHADANHPILLIDMDLDSAGMTYLLKLDEHFQKNFDTKALLIGAELRWSNSRVSDISKHELLSKFVPVGETLGVEDRSVLFLGVNDMRPFANSQMGGGKEDLICKLQDLCDNNNIPAMVLDSASGDQFAALLATKFATEIVCCMRPTVQFRMGTFNYLKRHALNNKGNNYILLPTVVPEKDVYVDGESQRESSINNIKYNISDIKKNSSIHIDETFIDTEMFGINEVQRFKWREDVLYALSKEGKLLTEDEEKANERYRKLAQLLYSYAE